MAKFIEVHCNGTPRLLNLGMIEEIYPVLNSSQIYFIYTSPGEQDFVTVDESYDELKRLILGGGKHGPEVD